MAGGGCGGIRNAVVPLQMAAPNFQYDDSVPPINATAVAIDKDNRNSNTTVRWAIDHLVIANPYLILIHIRHKSHRRYPLYVRMILIHRDQYVHNISGLVIVIFSFGSFAENDGDGGENDPHNIFTPFRAYCARKGVCSERHASSLSFEFVVWHLEWKKHGS